MEVGRVSHDDQSRRHEPLPPFRWVSLQLHRINSKCKILFDACIFKAVEIQVVISGWDNVCYTYNDVEVFASCDLTTAKIPADARWRANTTAHLTHEQIRLVDDRCRQRHRAWEPVLTVITHLVSVQPPWIVCTARNTPSLSQQSCKHCVRKLYCVYW